jgi:hypothetical protein
MRSDAQRSLETRLDATSMNISEMQRCMMQLITRENSVRDIAVRWPSRRGRHGPRIPARRAAPAVCELGRSLLLLEASSSMVSLGLEKVDVGLCEWHRRAHRLPEKALCLCLGLLRLCGAALL